VSMLGCREYDQSDVQKSSNVGANVVMSLSGTSEMSAMAL